LKGLFLRYSLISPSSSGFFSSKSSSLARIDPKVFSAYSHRRRTSGRRISERGKEKGEKEKGKDLWTFLVAALALLGREETLRVHGSHEDGACGGHLCHGERRDQPHGGGGGTCRQNWSLEGQATRN